MTWRWLMVAGALISGCGETPPPDIHDWNPMDRSVLAQMQLFGKQNVLMIGDSLTAQNPADTLCGLPFIRAGYQGGTWEDVEKRTIWPQLRTRVVLVMLGTNDAGSGATMDQAWTQRNEAFLDFLWTIADQVILIEPPPVWAPYLTPMNQLLLDFVWAWEGTVALQRGSARAMTDRSDFGDDGVHVLPHGYVVLNGILEAEACQWVM